MNENEVFFEEEKEKTPVTPDSQEGSTPESASAKNPQDAFNTEAPLVQTEKAPYHERYYLKYREGKRSVPLDLDGTKNFLQTLGFDGGELRQAREGTSLAEEFRVADTGKGNQMYCSYCGAEISGVEFFRLPDGRLRCTTCSNSIVTTKA